MIQSSRPLGPRHRAASVDLQTVLDALDSRRSRELLGLLGERALTVKEIAERTDIPRSTIYRYLNRLVEAGLVEESIRLDQAGRHESEYARRISDVLVSLSGDDEFTVGLF